jgi:hypothetical protein
MVFVNICIFLGIPLALLVLRWFFLGPDDDGRGGWTPWG